MYKKLKLFTPVIAALMALCAVLTIATVFFDRTLFYFSAVITCIMYVFVLIFLRNIGQKTSNMLLEIGNGIERIGNGDFTEFPIPVMAVYDNAEIIWCNELCTQMVFGGRDVRGEDASEIFTGVNIAAFGHLDTFDTSIGDKMYTVFVSSRQRNGGNVLSLYLVEDTQLKYLANEYYQTRPSVAIITVDNYDELAQDYKESERAQLMSEVEAGIERHLMAHSGFISRMDRNKFFAVIEERGISDMIAGKFELLDHTRKLHGADKMSATLSIGVGRGGRDLYEAEAMARQALDMCLGRGGDQAAVKTHNGYEFYGGVSKGIEKRTKVKSRIIAAALAEMIESSANVIIMGHRFADLDCFGSSIGMLKSVRSMGKQSVVAINRCKNLVQPLLKRMMESGYTDSDFVDPETAMQQVNDKTLLIILDTHLPHVLESEQLYRMCKNVVVIDHHRKLVGHIDNALIFYHEPYASSASEMVAELLQYFPVVPPITKHEAEAMLSGIMLDTKNFVLRTGVRTFEAAAYLRKLGADTVEVRKLFSSTMDAYQQRTSLVATAEVYRGCAIAASDEQFHDIKVIAPQAADELMNIDGVNASFVIFQYDNQLHVSARSMGGMNVQVVMEKMGGGGHHTMAAAQFSDESIENIRRRLMESIDDYYTAMASSSTT